MRIWYILITSAFGYFVALALATIIGLEPASLPRLALFFFTGALCARIGWMLGDER